MRTLPKKKGGGGLEAKTEAWMPEEKTWMPEEEAQMPEKRGFSLGLGACDKRVWKAEESTSSQCLRAVLRSVQSRRGRAQ